MSKVTPEALEAKIMGIIGAYADACTTGEHRKAVELKALIQAAVHQTVLEVKATSDLLDTVREDARRACRSDSGTVYQRIVLLRIFAAVDKFLKSDVGQEPHDTHDAE